MECVRLPDLVVTFQPDATLLVRSRTSGVGAVVPLAAAGVLAYCGDPRTADDVEAQRGPAGRTLFEALVDIGLLAEPASAAQTPVFFANYADVGIHRRMLADRPRVDAYAEAIAQTVRPGMAVLDAGTGNGLLACLAARAGARVVYAVDNSEILDLARDVFARNGVEDVVRPIRADLRKVVLPEKVDLVVTETFGLFALAEGAAADLSRCLDRNLAPGGRVVPQGVTLYLAPVGDPTLFQQSVGVLDDVRGLSFDPLRALARDRARGLDLLPEALLAPGQPWLETPWPGPGEGAGRLRFEALPGGVFCGLAGWFVVQMTDDLHLSTAPGAPPTHWGQVYFPVEPVEVRAGDTLEIDAAVRVAPEDRRGVDLLGSWSLGHQEGSLAHRVR